MPGDAPCSTPAAAGLAAAEGAGVAVEAIVCAGVAEPDAAGFGVACGVVRGAGVALGTNKRPRRCDAVGKGDADETGVELAAGVDDCSAEVALPETKAAIAIRAENAKNFFMAMIRHLSILIIQRFGAGDGVAV